MTGQDPKSPLISGAPIHVDEEELDISSDYIFLTPTIAYPEMAHQKIAIHALPRTSDKKVLDDYSDMRIHTQLLLTNDHEDSRA